MIAATARITTKRLTVRYLLPARAYVVRRRSKHPSPLAAGQHLAGLRLRTDHRSWAALARARRVLAREVLRDVGRAQVGPLCALALRASRLPPRLVPAGAGDHLLGPHPEPGLLAP